MMNSGGKLVTLVPIFPPSVDEHTATEGDRRRSSWTVVLRLASGGCLLARTNGAACCRSVSVEEGHPRPPLAGG